MLHFAREAFKKMSEHPVQAALNELCKLRPDSKLILSLADLSISVKPTSDDLDAAFKLGQEHPNTQPLYAYWDKYLLWFIGTEEEIVHRINCAKWL